MRKATVLPRGRVYADAGRPASALKSKPSSDAFDIRGDIAGAWAVDGPADYMDARGIDIMNAILDGTDQAFDELLSQRPVNPFGPDSWRRAVLTRLQGDYVHWLKSSRVANDESADASTQGVTYALHQATATRQLALEVRHE